MIYDNLSVFILSVTFPLICIFIEIVDLIGPVTLDFKMGYVGCLLINAGFCILSRSKVCICGHISCAFCAIVQQTFPATEVVSGIRYCCGTCGSSAGRFQAISGALFRICCACGRSCYSTMAYFLLLPIFFYGFRRCHVGDCNGTLLGIVEIDNVLDIILFYPDLDGLLAWGNNVIAGDGKCCFCHKYSEGLVFYYLWFVENLIFTIFSSASFEIVHCVALVGSSGVVEVKYIVGFGGADCQGRYVNTFIYITFDFFLYIIAVDRNFESLVSNRYRFFNLYLLLLIIQNRFSIGIYFEIVFGIRQIFSYIPLRIVYLFSHGEYRR